jgi:hypothetical protein
MQVTHRLFFYLSLCAFSKSIHFFPSTRCLTFGERRAPHREGKQNMHADKDDSPRHNGEHASLFQIFSLVVTTAVLLLFMSAFVFACRFGFSRTKQKVKMLSVV